MSTQHHIENEFQRGHAINDLGDLELVGDDGKKKAWVMTLKPFKKSRSQEQNALSHVWYQQLAAKLREYTADGYKAECKLRLGIPILRGEDEEFRAKYDATIKHLDYEQKITVMEWFPVTSLMNTSQLSQYLEQMQQTYADRVQLRFPQEMA
jgi:hypothetical protein